MRIGSLFSGAGGLDMAVEEVFGGEVIWQAEVDKAASKVLVYRFPCAPNLGDITQIDWKTVEPVDVLCLGFPCQDVSAAGKRAGIKDGTRSGLWSYAADAIDQLRPPLVVIENVRGLLSAQAHRNVEPDEATVGDRSDGPVLRALGAVLGDLSDLGYDAQWTTVAAADVGAPHRRERVFVVATDTSGWELQRRGVAGVVVGEAGNPERRFRDAAGGSGQDAAVSGDEPGVALLPTPQAFDRVDHVRSPEKIATTNGGCRNLRESVVNELLPTPNASDGERGGQHPDNRYNAGGLKHAQKLIDYVLLEPNRWGKYAPAIARWEQIAGPSPAPTGPNKNGNPRLSAAFSEWMMGWPPGWVTDPDIGISRNDQLKIIGNGVCPQQAAAALRYLLTVAEAVA